MSASLQQLIYFSRQKIEASNLDDELDSIVKVSVRNNRNVGVTGLLLAHQGWFLQILEGPAMMVHRTYGRIIRDRRHTGSQVVTNGSINARAFGEWDMCARRLSKTDDAILRVLDVRGSFDPSRFSADTCLRLLLAVRNIHDRLSSIAQTSALRPPRPLLEID